MKQGWWPTPADILVGSWSLLFQSVVVAELGIKGPLEYLQAPLFLHFFLI